MTNTIPTQTGTAAVNPGGRCSVTDPAVKTTDVAAFKLNHPKNYLLAPVAVAADESTDFLIREYGVNVPKRVIRGAVEAGLITPSSESDVSGAMPRVSGSFQGTQYTVSSLGEGVLTTAQHTHGGSAGMFEAFKSLHGSAKRFVDVFPEWRETAQRVAFQYPVTKALVAFLREQGALSLSELTWLLWGRSPDLAHRVFLHDTARDVLEAQDGERPQSRALWDSSLYRCETVFQYKSFLFHSGIVDRRGGDSRTLDPRTDMWALDTDHFTH